MGLMIGAMIIQGIQPGPGVMTEQPALFWGLIVSMWIGNFMLVLNLPLVGLWSYVLRVPYHMLYPAILVFCASASIRCSNATFGRLSDGGLRGAGYVFSKSAASPRRFFSASFSVR